MVKRASRKSWLLVSQQLAVLLSRELKTIFRQTLKSAPSKRKHSTGSKEMSSKQRESDSKQGGQLTEARKDLKAIRANEMATTEVELTVSYGREKSASPRTQELADIKRELAVTICASWTVAEESRQPCSGRIQRSDLPQLLVITSRKREMQQLGVHQVRNRKRDRNLSGQGSVRGKDLCAGKTCRNCQFFRTAEICPVRSFARY